MRAPSCRRSSAVEQGSHKPRVSGSIPLVGTIIMLASRFAAALLAQFPELPGQKLLVALSGGADSVALLDLLAFSFDRHRIVLHACHVHHHLRGDEADGDASFCASLCRRLGVELAVEHLVPEGPRGVSPEAWWRSERYRLLEEASHRHGCVAVATAHTRDDQAETVLLKLLRGAGPRGVAGIRRRQGNVVRPLLDFGRDELRDWLTGRGQEWREDSSNADGSRPRARVRHDLLPALRAFVPNAAEHLAAFAEVIAEDDALLGGLLADRATWPDVGAPVALAGVAALPRPLRRRWVLELAARLPLAEPPSRRQLAAVDALVAGGTPAALDLGRRWVLRRRGGWLHLSPPPCRPFGAVPASPGVELHLPGGFRARVGSPGNAPHHRVILAAVASTVPLAWRSVRSAERLAWPPGSSIAVALARAGVPAEWRRAWPVLETGGTMIWVPGVGVAPGWDAAGSDETVAELEEPWQRRVRS